MVSSTSRLSIITPSYNQGQFLRTNLESVRNQEYPDVEHLVVDGGSTDKTLDTLREFETETEDVEGYNLRWVSEPDRGQSHAINKGLKMATGDWIGWQNSDDFYLPGAFDTFADAVAANPDTDVVYGDLRIVNELGEETGRKHHTRPSKFVQRYYSLFTANQCTFFNADLLDRLDGVNESLDYVMDAELFWRILKSDARAVHVPEFLGGFRDHEAGKTAVISPQMRDELFSVYGETRIGRVLPDSLLSTAAAGLKAFYLLLDGRRDVVARQTTSKLTARLPFSAISR